MLVDRQTLANAVRVLSMDAVHHARSGHPGMPMGMADIAQVLWCDFLRHNPVNPAWLNRDRFILSNGHGSMLLYAVLHLTGYAISIEDLKKFRQLHSKTPGRPELGYTPGVETTTGPLGQGLANAVGMAIAERHLRAVFNRPEFPVIDHYTYVFLGDGCLMEGISHEACSLAGTLGLSKLIAFWDNNGISIDGDVQGWFTEDIAKRFTAYGWHAVEHVNGHDPEAIRLAILAAQAETKKPTLIACRTIIGKGAPNLAGTAKVHGEPLGLAEMEAAREQLRWSFDPFSVPPEIYAAWDAKANGVALEQAWQTLFTAYQQAYPALAQELLRRLQRKLPVEWSTQWDAYLMRVQADDAYKMIPTRKASQNTLNFVAPLLPECIGGSADLTESNFTRWSGATTLDRNHPEGNYLYYGVREFGMSAIMNGIALYGGCLPYGGTFLTFVDYARNAVRMAALMKQQVIFVYTHDSIGLGEDGPTHQPIEHIAMLRLTTGLTVWRPCDAVETAVAWQMAIEQRDAPSCLLFSRQKLPAQARSHETIKKIRRGGYILLESDAPPQVILIATGSEVAVTMEAAKQLQQQNVSVRVVSMPSTDVFVVQPLAYQTAVLPNTVTCRIAIEAGVSDFWYKYVGREGKVIGIDRYGESAPADDIFRFFGFTVERIMHEVEILL